MKKLIRIIMYITAIIMVAYMLLYSFLGQIIYCKEKLKEKTYIEHIIEKDIIPQYNDEQQLCIEGFAISDCYAADGHCYLVDVFIETVGSSNRPPRIDKWCCYVSKYQCDCDYIGSIFLEIGDEGL